MPVINPTHALLNCPPILVVSLATHYDSLRVFMAAFALWQGRFLSRFTIHNSY